MSVKDTLTILGSSVVGLTALVGGLFAVNSLTQPAQRINPHIQGPTSAYVARPRPSISASGPSTSRSPVRPPISFDTSTLPGYTPPVTPDPVCIWDEVIEK